MVCGQFGCVVNNTLGGSAAAYKGGIFGLNIYNRIAATSQFVDGSVGIEVDIESNAGSTYLTQTGISVVATTGHKQTPVAFSSGYVLAGQTSSIGIDLGVLVNSWGLHANSTFIMADWANDHPAFPISRGIDLRAMTFSSDAFSTGAFAITSGNGARIGTGTIDPTPTGMSVHVDGAICTAGTLTGTVTTAYALDGNHYWLDDAYGGVWEIGYSGAGSTSITSIVQTVRGYAQTPPANPVTLTPRGQLKRFVPGPITANLTWDTSRTALSVQPSGGATTFGGPVTLAADPATSMQPVTLQYYNAHLPTSLSPSGTAGGELSGTYPNPVLAATAVGAGSYTYASLTVDAKGRLTAASSGAAPLLLTGGTVTGNLAVAGTGTFTGGVTGPLTVGIAGQADLIITPGPATSNAVTISSSGTGGITIAGVPIASGAIGAVQFNSTARFNGTVGFNNTAPIAKPTVSGAKGSNAALASLLTALANYGLITDSSSA
jgi:hypothetical protein